MVESGTSTGPRGGAAPVYAPAPSPLGALVEEVSAIVCDVPTDRPESDGTLEWDSTTIVIVQAGAAGVTGLGYTYTAPAAADLVRRELAGVALGRSAMSPPGAWWAMCDAARNIPRRGLAMFAISAMDTALWDLKARLLDVPLAALLGQVREAAPIYGSGGFTSYTVDELQEQLGGWLERGIPRVKMKVGRDPEADPLRVRKAREAIGERPELFVDANGAYSVGQATRLAESFAESGVSWFEEPRPPEDLDGLRRIRNAAGPGMEIAAGEYGDVEDAFLRLIEAGAADVLQPDVTRCGGYTGLLRIAALCGGHQTPISLHCAPALSVPIACACREVRHVEYFHDHARLEDMLFDGAPHPESGGLRPDPSQPGNGLGLRPSEIKRFTL